MDSIIALLYASVSGKHCGYVDTFGLFVEVSNFGPCLGIGIRFWERNPLPGTVEKHCWLEWTRLN